MGEVFHFRVAPPPFADDPLTAGSTMIKAIHITELRTRIDAARVAKSLAAYPYSDPTIAAGTTTITAQHFLDLRAALSQLYVAFGQTPPIYTDPDLGVGTTMKAAHLAEIRAALLAIE